MMPSIVALTCAGGAAGITALELLRPDRSLHLVAIDADPFSYAQEIADEFITGVALVSDKSYGESLIDVLTSVAPDVVVPCHSGELCHFLEIGPKLRALGSRWPELDTESVAMLTDKAVLYDALVAAGVRVPRYARASSLDRAFPEERVVFKRRSGAGSRDLIYAEPRARCPDGVVAAQDYIEQVVAAGAEISFDGVVLSDGSVVGPITRVRLGVRGGLAVIGESVDLGDQGRELFVRVAAVTGARGALNVQAFFDSGELVGVTDVNPRFPAGGMALTAALGLNLPRTLIADLLHGPERVHVELPPFRRVRHYRKWSDVIVEIPS